MIIYFLFCLFVFGVAAMLFSSLTLKKIKEDEERLKKEKEVGVIFENELINYKDKKTISTAFGNKVSLSDFFLNSKDVKLLFCKGSLIMSKVNEDFDIISVNIEKIKNENESFFQVSMKAWVNESSMVKNVKPDNIVDFKTLPLNFNNSVHLKINDLMSVKNKVSSPVTV